MTVPLVELVRGGLRESSHQGRVVVIGPDGRVLRALGDVESPMYPRSANKPAQAAGMIRAGLSTSRAPDLALTAASHNGEPEHVEAVTDFLSRHGASADALRCPPDRPLWDPSRADPERITMNCSGKHAGMITTCLERGWSTEDYLEPDHPLQVVLRDTVAKLTGEDIRTTDVDGCGAPPFAVSLAGLARSFSRTVLAEPGTAERRVADAMREHPWLVAGTDREDTELMRAIPGSLSKSGAEGVLAAGLPDGHALALKIADGAARARLPAAIGALRAFGLGGGAEAAVDEGVLDSLVEQPLPGGSAGRLRPVPGAFG